MSSKRDDCRQSIVEWCASIQAALDDSILDDSSSATASDACRPASPNSPSSCSVSQSPQTLPARQGSWRSMLSVSPIWQWLSRMSHSCGHALLCVLIQSTSLAAEDYDYRDSFNALGIDTVEYQWQKWNMALVGE